VTVEARFDRFPLAENDGLTTTPVQAFSSRKK